MGRTAFLVGAGASFGTLKNFSLKFPPLAKHFGQELIKRVGNWETEYPELCKVAQHLGTSLEKVTLEALWTCIDYHAKFRGTFATDWTLRESVWELKSAVLQIYGQSCDAVADTLRICKCYTLGEIAKQVKAGDTLVSFNYDTLVERLVTKRGEIELKHCSGPRSDVVRFVKPHGSASWDLRNLGRNVTDGSPLLHSLVTDEARKGNVDPLLLGAVLIKSELIMEVQCYYHVHRVFEVVRDHWRAVADAIRDADQLVVLGYSFPKEDAYGRFFFREAMRERSTKKTLRVEYYELGCLKSERKMAIEEAFCGALDIKYKGEVKAASLTTAT